MGMRKMALAAALGLSMASAPVMAQTAALPTGQAASIDRAGATLDDANAQSRRFPFLIVFVVIAVGLGLYFALDNNDDGPTSP